MNTTPNGLTAHWVIGPRPGSPPRVRLPPRPRPRLQPHTLVVWVNPVPEPSHHLIQQIQAGHYGKSVAITGANLQLNPLSVAQIGQALARCELRQRALGRRAAASVFTGDFVVSSWLRTTSRVFGMPGRWQLLGEGEYTAERPHSSMGNRTPAGFAARCSAIALAQPSAPPAHTGCLCHPCS
jgi:hypothetical protein